MCHLLLAEGAGRRGRARHADPVAARHRAARELHAALAAAEDLPPHQGRQADEGGVRGRDHQHAVDAVRGGLSRRAGLGREHRRPARRCYARADANAEVLYDWAERTPWVENLAVDPATRSNTSVCLKIVDPAVAKLPIDAQRAFVKQLEAMLDKENAALRHRRPPRRAAALAHLVRLDGRDGRRRGAHALARLGLRRGQGRPRQGGVSCHPGSARQRRIRDPGAAALSHPIAGSRILR